ncbi:MAG: uroporphyrinogen-III C-methyltransferase [Gammaproteobacteria bacterium]|nr:uroporphyrinogen-III C-methyltransferase [Gammaproteobacteria bacterium]
MSEHRGGRALGWGGWLLLVLLLAVLVAGGAFGLRLQRQQAASRVALGRLSTAAAALQRALTVQERSAQDLSRRLQSDETRLQALAQTQAQMRSELGGGRERAQLFGVEQLLESAIDRAQLAGDAAGAAQALALADRRLAAIDDPGLLDVRKAIAAERAQLAALTLPDYDGALLALRQLAARVSQLPLAARPAAATPPAPAAGAPPVPSSWWARAGHTLAHALGSLFRVRRIDGSLQPQLTLAQAELVRTVLAAQLASAQAALLAHDDAAFHTALDGARQLLAAHFRGDDRAVTAAHAELERLTALSLTPTLPALDDSLVKLRAHLAGSG